MKVIRCKDCILDSTLECPLAYIENQTIRFVEHPPMFFCAKGRAKADYVPTRGDVIRNMTDRQLAVHFDGLECDAYSHGKSNAKWELGKSNIDWYMKFLSTPEGEDFE